MSDRRFQSAPHSGGDNDDSRTRQSETESKNLHKKPVNTSTPLPVKTFAARPETLEQRRARLGACALGFSGTLAEKRAGIGTARR